MGQQTKQKDVTLRLAQLIVNGEISVTGVLVQNHVIMDSKSELE